MKIAKIYAIGAIALVGAGFAACSDVTDPVFHAPDASKFTLFTPPLQDQYFQLSENGTFELTLSGQPDYGFSAITQYRADVSLTPEFTEGNYRTLTPTGTGTLSRMTLKEKDLAIAINELHGVESEDDYQDKGIEKVYFRGAAFINGVEESYVTTTNVVSLNKVQNYFVLAIPGSIYCIGNYLTDWVGPTADNAEALIPYMVTEADDAIGSNVFYATIDFQENAPIFRFYTNLEGWDAPAEWSGDGKTGAAHFFTMGAAGGENADKPVPFPDFVAGATLTHNVAETKDSFSFPNYTGVVKMVVDLSGDDTANYAATFSTPE